MMVITQTCTGDDFNKAMEAQKTRIVYGWRCPKCGRGNSPYVTARAGQTTKRQPQTPRESYPRTFGLVEMSR